MNSIKKPELLAPAGDLEKLYIAIAYGADAVYIGGQSYGLRAKAKNFTFEEMETGIKYAHSKNKKIYVSTNIYARNEDFLEMGKYFEKLESINVDAVIISDPGVFTIAKKNLKNTEIHISTQANNTNYLTAEFWKNLGATRIVVARELSITEISEMSKNVSDDFEIEAFVHGAMCISYSGRCLLSNYMTGRDANRGSCSQACRWKYHLVEEKRPGEFMPVYEDENGTYIFNSKDLCMIKNIPDLIKAGISSFKIEGRMKSPYYVGTTIKAYREAIDDFFTDPNLYNSKLDYYFNEVSKNSHRQFTTGFYFGQTDEHSQVYKNNSYIRTHDFVGIVKSYDKETQVAIIEQRNKFILGDKVEFFLQTGESFYQEITEMYNDKGISIEEAPHPQQILKIKTIKPVEEFDMLRMEI